MPARVTTQLGLGYLGRDISAQDGDVNQRLSAMGEGRSSSTCELTFGHIDSRQNAIARSISANSKVWKRDLSPQSLLENAAGNRPACYVPGGAGPYAAARNKRPNGPSSMTGPSVPPLIRQRQS